MTQSFNLNHQAAKQMDGRFLRPSIPARINRDKRVRGVFFVLTLLPVLLLLFILILLLIRSWPILKVDSFWKLISGKIWSPQTGSFGFYPFITGTFWVTIVAGVLAIPPSLMSAIYLSEYAGRSMRAITKPLLDILAAIPSVVYGVWGLLIIVPFIGDVVAPFSKRVLGFIPLFSSVNPTGYSILAGGIVLAVMIAPFIISVTYEVLSVVPQGTREAALALGANRWQSIKHVVIPQVFPGIAAGVVLGTSRALGETMAVLMVVGNVAKIPSSIFDSAYPLPALIANNYGEMMSFPLYDSALLLAALILLLIILIFNILSVLVLRGVIGKAWA